MAKPPKTNASADTETETGTQLVTTAVSADGETATVTAVLPPVIENVTITPSAETAEFAQAFVQSLSGPVARQEIRYKGKTYGPGEHLPGDIDRDTIVDLARLRAI